MKLNNIPNEIKQLNQWVCTKKSDKVPRMATSPYNASSTNPNTWVSFDKALESVKKGVYDYLGFVFNNNGIVGIDIDDGYDSEGFLTYIASDIIGKCGSYTEKSKSGRGFHILLKGDIPFTGKNNLRGVEIYKQSRFFIMTGDTLIYDEIIENQTAIDYVIKKYFTPTENSVKTNIISDRIYTPIWGNTQGRIQLRPSYPKIASGCRNISLTSLAGALHNQGYSKQEILKEISYCNTIACVPVLPYNELITIVNSITRYNRVY